MPDECTDESAAAARGIEAASQPPGRAWRFGLLAVLLAGAMVRTWQALGLASLWRDEVALGLNFDARGVSGLLLHALDHHQVAPPGFLVLVETATSWLGGPAANDFAFRCVPWLLGLAGLIAAVLALRRVVDGWMVVVGLLPFALGTGAAYYGAAVKPYGADVGVCLLFLWAALRQLELPGDRLRAALAGWLCGPALLLSIPAVPLAGCLVALLGLHAGCVGGPSDATRRLRSWLSLAIPWTLFAALSSVFVLRLRQRPIHEFMLDYWQSGFPDLGRPLHAALWLPRHAAGALQHFLFFRGPEVAPNWLLHSMKAAVAVTLVLGLWGLWTTARRNVWAAAILATPLTVAGVLAASRLYPYLERLGLWTVPTLLLPAAVALDELRRRGTPWRVTAVIAACGLALPILASSLWLQRPPTETQTLRPVIAELATRVQPGDLIYVPCGGGQLGLRFYAHRSGLDLRTKIFEGACHEDRDGYRREARSLAGRGRVWLFLSDRPRGHAEWVLEFYRTHAVELDRIDDPAGRIGLGSTRAFLLDLGSRSGSAGGGP